MKSISKGDNYGTTVHTSNPAVDFPRANSSSGYGKKKPFVKPHGGDQYGTTQQKSQPAISFPNAKVALPNGRVGTHGTALTIDSEKVVKSVSGGGMSIKSQNTRDSGSTAASGCSPATHYGKKGQHGNSTPKVF